MSSAPPIVSDGQTQYDIVLFIDDSDYDRTLSVDGLVINSGRAVNLSNQTEDMLERLRNEIIPDLVKK
jgi:hypothetical protein